jgi:hypothetical protein
MLIRRWIRSTNVVGLLAAVVSGAMLPASSGCLALAEEDLGTLEQESITYNSLTYNSLTYNSLTYNSLTYNSLTYNSLSTSELGNTAEGRSVLYYLVRCALPQGTDVTATFNDVTYTFSGLLGLAPGWQTGPLSTTDKGWMSACMLAHVNAFGVSIQVSVRGNNSALVVTTDEIASHTAQEGAFFGDIFASPQVLMSCVGSNPFGSPDSAYRVCASDATACGFVSAGDCTTKCNVGSGLYKDCAAPTGTVYAEVITVYLKGL